MSLRVPETGYDRSKHARGAHPRGSTARKAGCHGCFASRAGFQIPREPQSRIDLPELSVAKMENIIVARRPAHSAPEP